MKEVDFAKLSEQYASFFVAIGGISITVLAIVLSLASPSNELKKGDLGSFLITALIVATVCCFTGAHMMAETAALLGRAKELFKDRPSRKILPRRTPLGEYLFLLASTNIFIAVILVLFAVMLLPSASTLPNAGSIRGISFLVFIFVVGGALFWMILAAKYRMSVKVSWKTIIKAIVFGFGLGCIPGTFSIVFGLGCIPSSFSIVFDLLLGCIPGFFSISDRTLLLWFTFLPITLLIEASLFYFAWNFKDSDKASSRKVEIKDITIFSVAVTASYISLIIAGIRIMFW